MIRKTIFCLMLLLGCFCTQTTALANNFIENESSPNSPHEEALQGGYINYEGTIGPYKVDFTFLNLHMGNGIEFYYTYKTITVNKGQPIQLHFQKNKGDYQIWYEYINGKHTGTFTIQRTLEKITGTFKNSKGKTFKVKAHVVDTNYVEE